MYWHPICLYGGIGLNQRTKCRPKLSTENIDIDIIARKNIVQKYIIKKIYLSIFRYDINNPTLSNPTLVITLRRREVKTSIKKYRNTGFDWIIIVEKTSVWFNNQENKITSDFRCVQTIASCCESPTHTHTRLGQSLSHNDIDICDLCCASFAVVHTHTQFSQLQRKFQKGVFQFAFSVPEKGNSS